MSFEKVAIFEKEVAKFFGAPYAVAVDCCTHGVELCLRYTEAKKVTVPVRTYLSIPMLADKLNIERVWIDQPWQDYYYLTKNVVDAAVLWRANSYISGTLMSLSFQFRKHLSLGRGGIILLDNKEAYDVLKKMVYDGRSSDKPWGDQNIKMVGYHYYMTPEIASMGIEKFKEVAYKEPKRYGYLNYPYLPDMEVFKK